MKLGVLLLATLVIANGGLAADQHVTLRLEDGLPAGGHALPITIVVPITAGKGEAGAALASFYEYGPHTIDGSALQVAGDRITGKLSGKSRSGSALPVWAWPDAPGFTGGREQDLGKWQYTAEPDPVLVEAAVKEAATPIHPVEPGTGEVWQHHAMQRDMPRCTAPPTFDIRPLPVAAKYRLSVTRIVGKPMTLVDEDVTDPFAALSAAWDKRTLGQFRFQFLVDGKPSTAMDVWLREPGNRPVACPSIAGSGRSAAQGPALQGSHAAR